MFVVLVKSAIMESFNSPIRQHTQQMVGTSPPPTQFVDTYHCWDVFTCSHVIVYTVHDVFVFIRGSDVRTDVGERSPYCDDRLH